MPRVGKKQIRGFQKAQALCLLYQDIPVISLSQCGLWEGHRRVEGTDMDLALTLSFLSVAVHAWVPPALSILSSQELKEASGVLGSCWTPISLVSGCWDTGVGVWENMKGVQGTDLNGNHSVLSLRHGNLNLGTKGLVCYQKKLRWYLAKQWPSCTIKLGQWVRKELAAEVKWKSEGNLCKRFRFNFRAKEELYVCVSRGHEIPRVGLNAHLRASPAPRSHFKKSRALLLANPRLVYALLCKGVGTSIHNNSVSFPHLDRCLTLALPPLVGCEVSLAGPSQVSFHLRTSQMQFLRECSKAHGQRLLLLQSFMCFSSLFYSTWQELTKPLLYTGQNGGKATVTYQLKADRNNEVIYSTKDTRRLFGGSD